MAGITSPTFGSQFRAVFLKNATLQIRQRALMVFQVLPFLVLFAVAVGITFGVGGSIRHWCSAPGTIYFPSYQPNWIPYWYVDNTNSGKIGQMTLDGTPDNIPSYKGLLGFFQQSLWPDLELRDTLETQYHDQMPSLSWENDSLVPLAFQSGYTPFFLEKKGYTWNDLMAENDNISDSIQYWQSYGINNSWDYNYCYNALYATNNTVDNILCALQAKQPDGIFTFDKFEKNGYTWYFTYKFYAEGYSAHTTYLTTINNLLWRFMANATLDNITIPNDDYNDYGLAHATNSDNFQVRATAAHIPILAQLVMWVLGPIIMLPFFMHKVVLERSTGLMEVNRMNGLTEFTYWASLFLMDYVQYFVLMSILLILGAACSLQTATQSPALWYINLYILGVPVIILAYFFAIFCLNPTKAVIFGYLWSLLHATCVFLLNFLAYNITIPLPPYISWIPILAPTRALVVGAQMLAFQGLVDNTAANATMGEAIGWALGTSLALFLVVAYFDQILTRPNTISKSPFFPCTEFCSRDPLPSLKDVKFRGTNDYSLVIDEDDSKPLLSTPADVDIEMERQEVEKLEGTGIPLLISHVEKVFGADTDKEVKAVQGISFHVDDNECFGLLGPNGAGKTTLVNIIAGLATASGGRVFVGGAETTRDEERKLSRTMMGLCPQHDILYDDLTVEEHLLFYSRLRGWSRGDDILQVEGIIRDVGLVEEAQRVAKDLSGGQQRRLSLGIALCGNPKIIILDEPTSGLDPGSKRGVWEILAVAKHRSAFLLTTHSMEEAEVLCSRIGIMSRGTLKCIGTPQHLKRRFGQGYKIDIVVEEEKKELADAFVRSLVPKIELVAANGGYLSYQTDRDVRLSKIFAQMEIGKKQNGLINWGISQASLQEVFLTITKQDETEADFE